MAVRQRSDTVIAALRKLVHTTVRRYVHDPDVVEDLTHEALLRVLRVDRYVDDESLPAYATVVARNTAFGHPRAERYRAAKHRRAAAAAERVTPGPGEEPIVVDAREAEAVRAALAALAPADRALLDAVDVAGLPVTEVAAREEVTAGTARVRLLRARARLRTRYLLALRGITPPSDRCLPVLDALSARDRARQRLLHAQDHLEACASCASLAEPLVTRRRPTPLLALLPFLLIYRWLRRHPKQAAGGATAVAAMGVAAFLLAGAATPELTAPPPITVPPAATTAATPPAPLRTPTRPLLPVPGDVAASVGEPVVADGVPVAAVVGDEAFWVGTSPGDRLLVVLATPVESAATIRAGQRVSFTGRLAATTVDLLAGVGVGADEGAGLALAQGAHVVVDGAAVGITG